MGKRYIDSKQACDMLGIRNQTLYAYVSRGLIRSEAARGNSRAKRYHREDVEKLAQRKQIRSDPSKVARGALRVGEPILESALTLITEDSLFYRGHDVVELASQRTIEEVAALMWTGDMSAIESIRGENLPLPVVLDAPGISPLQHLQAVLAIAAAADVSALDLQAPTLYRVGWRILHLSARVLCPDANSNEPIAVGLQQAWLPEQPDASRLLNATLIICADHELNVSAFTARCVASSGANLYAVVTAALSAMQGVLHGGVSQRVEAMMHEIESEGSVSRVVRSRLQRGELIAGFGHAVYHGADPRAQILFELIDQHFPQSQALGVAAELCEEVRQVMDLECNVDLALVTLRRAAGLPEGGALQLFALGRVVGWIAHAIEQYGEPLIRPRATYTGPIPNEEPILSS